jgi:hypothetical protein
MNCVTGGSCVPEVPDCAFIAGAVLLVRDGVHAPNLPIVTAIALVAQNNRRGGSGDAAPSAVLLRLAYLGMTNVFAVLRLLPTSNQDEDVEILALRHQITVLERQLGKEKVRFDAADRAFLAAVLHRLPRDVLRRLRLLVRPDTMLRWHRDLLARRHAARSRSKRPGRPRTLRSVRALVLRLARENPS